MRSIIFLFAPLLFLECFGFVVLSLINYGRSIGDRLLVAPFAAIAVILAISGNLLFFDVTMRVISIVVAIVALVVVAVFVLGRRRGFLAAEGRAVWPVAELVAFLGVLATAIIVHGFPYVSIGSFDFIGNGTRDAWNYTVVAQFFMDWPFSTVLQEGNQDPLRPLAVGLKSDRVGASVLQAFVASLADSSTKETWGVVSLLGPILMVFALWKLANETGLSLPVKTAAVAFGSTLPGLAWIYLENTFLAHAVSLPFLTLYLSLLPRLLETPSLSSLAVCGGVCFAFLYLYSDMSALILAVTFLIVCWQTCLTPRRWHIHASVGLGVLLLGCFAVPSNVAAIYVTLMRMFGGLALAYPADGLTIQAFVRVFAGGLLADQSKLRIYAVTAFVVLSSLLAFAAATNSVLQTRSSHWMAILAVLCLPMLLLSNPEPSTYIYYKCLTSFAPLLPIALGCLASTTRRDGTIGGGTIWFFTHAILATGMILAMAGTVSDGTRFLGTYNTWKRDAEFSAWERKLEATSGENVLIDVLDDHKASWLAFHARKNRIWLSRDFYGPGWSNAFQGKRMGFLDLESLPKSDVIIVKLGR